MMRNQIRSQNSPQSSFITRFGGFCVSLLAVGIAGVSTLPAIAGSNSNPSVQQISAASAPAASLPDGVYLYGQSSKPEQIGQGYFVFEVNHGKVIGALYMPRSSFDCASGSFHKDELALTVVNSYDRSTNPFNIALETSSNVASQNGGSVEQFSLQGFHQISDISQNDRRILNTCKADLQ